MAERDLVIKTAVTGAPAAKAELDSLKSSVDGVSAENAQVAASANAASTALREEGAAAAGAGVALGTVASQAGSAASSQAALVAALDGAERAVTELAAASQVGGAEMQAAATRALGAYQALRATMQTTAATSTVTPAQLAQVEALNIRLVELVGSEAAVAAATRVTTTALTSQGVEAAKVETILELKARVAQTAAAREIAALNGLRDATRIANIAISDLGNATVVGGEKMTVALLAARNAVAALEVAQAKLRAAGGIVPPQNVALLASYDAQVAALSATTNVAATSMGRAATSTRLFGAAASQAGAAIAGKAVNLGSLTAGFMRFLGPVGLAIAAISLLPTVIKVAKEQLEKLTGGVGDLEKGMEGFDATMKKFGVSLKDGFSFKEAQTGIDIFIREYQGKLKIGDNATRNFVANNKTSISQWMQAYEDAKQQIPTALLDIADKYDILTPKQQELIDKFKASKKPVDELADSVNKLGKEMSADFTFDFATGKQITDIRAGLQGVATDVRDVVVALREVPAAANAAFPPVYGGGSSQLGPATGVPAVS